MVHKLLLLLLILSGYYNARTNAGKSSVDCGRAEDFELLGKNLAQEGPNDPDSRNVEEKWEEQTERAWEAEFGHHSMVKALYQDDILSCLKIFYDAYASSLQSSNFPRSEVRAWLEWLNDNTDLGQLFPVEIIV